jgi:hypothetical protein
MLRLILQGTLQQCFVFFSIMVAFFGVFSVLGMGVSSGEWDRFHYHYYCCCATTIDWCWQQDETPIGVGESTKSSGGDGHSVNPSDAQTLPLRNPNAQRGQFNEWGC